MVIGLGFFIRASTKDRIEVARFGSLQKADALKQAVLKYFQARAYRPIAEDSTADTSTVDMTTLVGLVSPSIFMAVFCRP
ncbi:MAG: cofactor assembly of complex C subunit B [Phormidesmis sp. RL_2_1]|nr:cofactor assembly of complex C subunit B [Phormidesmis sp. RL_2_1]